MAAPDWLLTVGVLLSLGILEALLDDGALSNSANPTMPKCTLALPPPLSSRLRTSVLLLSKMYAHHQIQTQKQSLFVLNFTHTHF
jgi:hypothetical protein